MEREPPMNTPVASRKAAVEESLLPAIVVPGRAETMRLDARMAHYGTPGTGIAVIAGGEIEWAGGYGVREEGAVGSVGRSTLFQAASISKPVAALGALLLVQRGLLNLDEDVNVRLRSWKVPQNDLTRREPVTLRRILSHTAGLTVHGVPGHARGAPLPALPDFLDGKHADSPTAVVVDLLPGIEFRYSGGGMTVMQLLMEDVTGRPFTEFMADEILAPLEMCDSTFEHPLPGAREADVASGHGADGRPIEGKWTTFAALAAGGLWTTPSDLARLAIAVQDAYAGRSTRVIGREVAREMLRLQLAGGPCGLGFWLTGEGASRRFFHGGSNIGYRCQLVAYAERRDGAVVMTNGERGDGLWAEVLNGIASVYGWPDYVLEKQVTEVAAERLAEYAGTYVIDDALPVTIGPEASRLVASAPGFGVAELLCEGADTFFSTELPVALVFRRDASGAITGADVDVSGTRVRAVKH